MTGTHVWAAVIGAGVASLVFVIAPLLADLRPFSSERRWSKKWRAQRADISRLRDRGTP